MNHTGVKVVPWARQARTKTELGADMKLQCSIFGQMEARFPCHQATENAEEKAHLQARPGVVRLRSRYSRKRAASAGDISASLGWAMRTTSPRQSTSAPPMPSISIGNTRLISNSDRGC